MDRILAAAALALGLLGGLVGCGSETTGPLPPAVNPFTDARVGTDSTLELMTWNIQQFARDGAVTATYVRQAIEALDVDIIAVQEISWEGGGPRYFDEIAAALPDWDGYRATSNSYINLGYFYRVGGDLVVESFTEILADEYDALPRTPLVLQGRYRDQPIVVINNHYWCCSGREARRDDASLLLEKYVRDNLDDVPVVILGDLNDSLTDPPELNVFANFLADTVHWRFVDLSIASDPQALWSYPSWPSHLDHILITDELFGAADKAESLVEVVPLARYLPANRYADSISDHLPVVLRLAY